MNLTSKSPDGAGPSGTVFAAKSQWYMFLPLLVGALIAGWVALELGLNTRLRAQLGVAPWIARELSWIIGGVAGLVFVAAAWAWYGELRWVAVSRDGIRWFRNGRTHSRAWSELTGIQRVVNKMYLDGQLTHTAHGAEVQFSSGSPLRIGPDLIRDYEALIEAINAGPGGRAGGLASAAWMNR